MAADRYVIEVVHDEETNDCSHYGPYTEATSEKMEERIKAFLVRQAQALDLEDDQALARNVHRIPLVAWKQPKLEHGPKRPICPKCKVKMGVWQEQHGDEAIHGVCNTADCDNYQAEILLEVVGKRYKVIPRKRKEAPKSA